jgi:hypothetical protein
MPQESDRTRGGRTCHQLSAQIAYWLFFDTKRASQTVAVAQMPKNVTEQMQFYRAVRSRRKCCAAYPTSEKSKCATPSRFRGTFYANRKPSKIAAMQQAGWVEKRVRSTYHPVPKCESAVRLG